VKQWSGVSSGVFDQGEQNRRTGLRPLLPIGGNEGGVPAKLPKNVQKRQLKNGIGYYFCIPPWARKPDCPLLNQPLGTDLAKAAERAARLNDELYGWSQQRKRSLRHNRSKG
jgi:hypothetical protein